MARNQRVEQLNEGQITQIREIFTLFDKNSDGYVNTSELYYIIRGLDMNPTQSDIKEMEKDVDPNETGSFDQMNLISLIARRPRTVDTLEDMKESIQHFVQDDPNDDGEEGATNQNKRAQITVDSFKYMLGNSGEKL